jgi:uncharacterized FAD-dependent dehydrogenase
MTKVYENIKLPIDGSLEEHLEWLAPNHGPYRILRQSVDARTRHSPHFIYSVEVADAGEALPVEEISVEKISRPPRDPILIIGSGPAGLFAALRLVERGMKCILFERGSSAEKRMVGINRFWRYGQLDSRNNVCYGEGGAGLYSDGKLITRIKSPHIPYVLRRLVDFGAPEEIQWLSNPHVGSDRIRRVIPVLRKFLLENGCEIFFDTQVTELLYSGKSVVGLKTEHGTEFHSPHVVLATGHSAKDVFEHLGKNEIHMEGKSFAMGLRIEHSQSEINRIQFREFAEHPALGAANYKLTYQSKDHQTGVYSFCMCPGGYVLSSGTEANGIVCNGMSNYKRNSPFANAAIVVTVDHEKIKSGPSQHPIFAGLQMRENLEQRAFQAVQSAGGTKQLPTQTLTSFLGEDSLRKDIGPVSSPSGGIAVDLRKILPRFMTESLVQGFADFQRKMKGFISESAQLMGVETRTSCPIRITRHPDTFQSISHAGLYPAGEGAGYAGGITSAACDGVRIADAIAEIYK